MGPKSHLDWLAVVSLWVGTLVFAVKSLGAPLLPGAPPFLAAGFWNFVPLVFVSIALAIFVYRQFRPVRAEVAPVPPALRSAEQGAPALAPPIRRLTEAEKSTITKLAIALPESPTGDYFKEVLIFLDTSSRVAIRFGQDILAAFKAARWNVQEAGGTGNAVFPPSGIALSFQDYGELAADQRCVKEALDAAAIPYDIMPIQTGFMGRTTIYVTDPD